MMAASPKEPLRATSPRTSAWVSAHAGSGKTYVLTRRVLRLLLDGTDPGKILCLTFTRAAAAEMANRVFAQLGGWAALPNDELLAELNKLEGGKVEPGRMLVARALFAKAIETPGGLKIQTIHAFCERLLQQFPFEANVPAHFEVVDDGVAAELRQRALAGSLAEAGADPDGALAAALTSLVGFAGDTRFADLVAKLQQERETLRLWIARNGGLEEALEALARRLEVEPGKTCEAIEEEVLADAGLPPESWPRLIDIFRSSDKKSDAQCAERLEEALAAAGARRGAAYLGFWLTGGDTVRKSLMTKALRDAHPQTAALLDTEKERIEAVMRRLRAAQVFQATAALTRLGDDILNRYTALKLERGLLDYDDLIAAAHGLLTRRDAAPWVLYKLDGGIDHMLIDEAQDTSPLQWEVVRALADEALSGKGARELTRTIFAVGDEKQSIYSFQGADPSAFDRMRRFFKKRVEDARQGWDDVPLAMSFRSAPAILDAVDAVFARAAARAGLQETDRKLAHSAERIADPGIVEIWPPELPGEAEEVDIWAAPLENRRAEHPRERLARRIRAEIERLCAKETITDKGRTRRITPGDILILVRRRNDFVDHMIAALKQRDIPVAGADRLKLREHIAVQDLLAAADFTLLPEDDLTLAALLKSPLIGLGEEDLFALAHGRAGGLWTALDERKEQEPFAAAHATLAGWRGRADYAPPFAFFSYLLGARGGRARMLARRGP